jgi:hypothetical protein
VGGCYWAAHRVAGESGLRFRLGFSINNKIRNVMWPEWVAAIGQLTGLQVRVV